MIVLLGPLADTQIATLVARLYSRGAAFTLFDPRNYLDEWHVSWDPGGDGREGRFRYGPRTLDLDRVDAIYVHMLEVLDPDRDFDTQVAELGRRPSELSLSVFADTFHGLVVNRPSAGMRNSSKLFQKRLVESVGLKAPRTLVTSSAEEARRFYEQCRGAVVYKSVSWRRSVVRRLEAAEAGDLDGVRHCPTQFQEYVEGTDIRVHTVGEELFATEIEASTDDYRYVPAAGYRRMRAVRLDLETESRCRALAAAAGLTVAGIDLRRSPEGEHYCFEVNPIPGFLFYERHSGQPISEAVAALLCGVG